MPTLALQRCVLLCLLVLIGVLAGATGARAESPVLRRLGAAEGLPSGRVLDLAEDSQGRLWIATLDGVASFDGYELQVHRYQHDLPDSLPGNVTQVLMIDRQDRLWVGLEGLGLVRHLGGGRFVRPPESNPQARTMDAWALAEDPEQRVWVGGYQSGLLVLDEAMQTVASFRAGERGLLSDITLWLTFDRSGRLWVASERGVQRFDGQRFETASFDGASEPVMVFRIAETERGMLAATRNGVYLARQGLSFERLSQLPPGGVSAVLLEGDDALWVGTPQGLIRDAPDERLHWGPQSGSEIGKQRIVDLHRDREGGLWIATDGVGVFRLPPHWRRIRSWLDGGRDLAASRVHAVALTAGGALYSAGADGVLERIDLEDGEVSRITAPDREVRSLSVVGLELAGEHLWLAHSAGLERHALSATAQPLVLSRPAPRSNPIIDLLADPGGDLWLLTGQELQRLDADAEVRQRWHWSNSSVFANPRQLRRAADGRLWLVGSGIAILDPNQAQISAVPELGSEPVDAIALDGGERLWLARKTGLQRYQREQTGWQLVGNYPLPGSVEAGDLWLDPEQHVWVSSARGLLHFDPLRERYQHYTLIDGLPDQVFRPGSIASDDRGQFAVVSQSGVLLVDPQEFERPEGLPPVRVQPLRWQRQGRQLSADAADLELQHDDRELRFSARAASFANPESWRFRHRILPFDPHWLAIGHQGERSISSLPPGLHRWELEIAGPWSDWQPAAAGQILVAPPWWARGWARAAQLGLIVLLLAALVWAVKRRAQQKAAEALRESQRRWALQANEQKTRFVQTLAHELRTPMTGVMGMAELLAESELDERQREQIENLRRAGDLLLRQLNETLDLARIEAGSLELRDAPFCPHQVIVQSVGVMRPLALRKKLSLPIDIGPDVPAFVAGDADRVQQILLNLLGNAIKFTETGSVTVRLSREAEQLCWRVIDTGAGLSLEQQARLFTRFSQVAEDDSAQRPGSSGLGLSISRELAQMMGGELSLNSEPGVGTEVCLRLPLRLAQAPAPATREDASRGCAAGLRVLLVEDDPEAAAAIIGLLELEGCQVDHASSPLQALSQAVVNEYQLALLDLDLPGMDGRQLARLLSAQGLRFPLWAVTARLQEGLEQALVSDGIEGLLAKPVQRSRLNGLLSGLASRANQNG
ncbi:hybrid sensor histidine kinase/response regulator [Pseudomarimonas arenosa]|uniref:histidine kinase n=1 Tax=Pseudomarimonas arenosa TaxID=2774145 RepID=A0AAW3ZFS4_9GAMM|nr:hybrid sensor histidine kinase/response regulator [Pseudomarimonas arenosa]MBD8525003.1 response regulator [Pseudomarimonas arenosa]